MDHPGDTDQPLPRLTRKSPLIPTVKLCPRCLKPLTGGSKYGGWLIPQDYFCSNCGYAGKVFVERDLGSPPVGQD